MGFTPSGDRTLFALVDCNNFFVSCERLFNPQLNGRPVVVLSNNGGCIVARSEEAKALGIPMGAPYFEWREKFERNGGIALTAHFSLYSDLSKRVMATLAHFHGNLEIYSVDEAFVDFSGLKDPVGAAQNLRERILQWTGIPVSIGLGWTKTLAKVANRFAKKKKRGLFSLVERSIVESALIDLDPEEVWGIGRKSALYLKQKGIYTALELIRRDLVWLKSHFSKPLLTVVLELQGVNCYELEDVVEPKKSILTSRSFKEALVERATLEEALASFTALAACKLREEGSVARVVTVFIMTNRHSKDARDFYYNQTEVLLEEPTHFTPELLEATKKGLERIYRPHLAYKRAGILLSGLSDAESGEIDFFQEQKQDERKRKSSLMELMDSVNAKRPHLLYFASQKKRERRMSSLDDIPTVRF